ncbi:MAG: SDR family oxidoreductase [Clostridia bacterium]|nr:SDR family oxidoreductase [Clostridia bacterium]
MFDFKGKVAVVTGGAHGIGLCICERFKEYGADTVSVDINEPCTFKGDISDKDTLEKIAEFVVEKYGKIDFLINNAPPPSFGIENAGYEDFENAMRIGVTAPFYLSKLFSTYFREGGAIVNISSSRDRMSQPGTESYTAAKGGISALTHALAISFAGRVRVNSVSPGWIDTCNNEFGGADALQQPVGRVGKPLDIANAVLYLCSDMAGFITGENICIDGGMTKQMIYHNDYGWKLEK